MEVHNQWACGRFLQVPWSTHWAGRRRAAGKSRAARAEGAAGHGGSGLWGLLRAAARGGSAEWVRSAAVRAGGQQPLCLWPHAPPLPLPLEPRAQLLSDGHLHLAGAPGCRQRAGCSPCPPSPLGRYPARAEEADAASSCGVSVAPVPSASCLCKPSKGCWRWRHYS